MTENVFITSWDEQIPILIQTRRGLRSITLRPRITPHREIRISKPWLATSVSALQFVEQKRAWLEKYFARAPEKRPLRDGDIIEFLGRNVQIKNVSGNAAPRYVGAHICAQNDRAQICALTTLAVGGTPEHLERRVRDFIKKELLAEIKKIIKESWPAFANAVADKPILSSGITPALAAGVSRVSDRGVGLLNQFYPTRPPAVTKQCTADPRRRGGGDIAPPKRIALRDTTTRWGSCSTSGTISFSWRLAFAPYEVMRYVVLHELAHCRHMNHSPEFWATVAQLYGDGVGRAKRWLTLHGSELHRYL